MYFQDCHGTFSNFNDIRKDDTQNFVVLGSLQNQTHTVVTFKRQLETCDPRDFPFSKQTVNIAFGFGDHDVVPSHLNYLKFRDKGSKRIRLLNPTFEKVDSFNNFKTWDAVVKNVN